ncbi:MAG: glucose PTS transporter subunit EIIB [Flaviflexus sp.]|nr:glucose PTS transporter subunit EIIB [Flaviflexus sp.]
MEKAQALVAALGGPENIKDIEACITRIRVEVGTTENVSEAALKDAGAYGVVIQNNEVVQVILGPDAEDLAEKMR